MESVGTNVQHHCERWQRISLSLWTLAGNGADSALASCRRPRAEARLGQEIREHGASGQQIFSPAGSSPLLPANLVVHAGLDDAAQKILELIFNQGMAGLAKEEIISVVADKLKKAIGATIEAKSADLGVDCRGPVNCWTLHPGRWLESGRWRQDRKPGQRVDCRDPRKANVR